MLYLVRHGQTAANAAQQIQGQRDLELTALGHEQVAALALALPVATAAAVICSPLRRARQTAAALGAACATTIDDRWIEMDYGEFEGAPIAEVRHALWEHWSADPTWAPTGGESHAAVAARVAEACEDLRARFGPDDRDEDGGGDVIVVTHVNPIKMAVAWTLGVGPQVTGRMFVPLASITTIDIGRPNPVLTSFSALAGPGTGGTGG